MMTSTVQSTMIDEKLDKNIAFENQIENVVVSSESSSSSDNVSRRDAWSKPVNGGSATVSSTATAGVEADVAPGIVIGGGADLWPSLSEGVNTRVKPTYRAVPENSVSLTSNASSSKNSAGHSGSRTNSSYNGSRSGSYRQSKSGAARSSSGNGERSHQQHHRPSSQGPVSDASSNNGSHNGNSQLEANQNGPRPQLHGGGNHPQHRDSNRRGNGGPSRGDGSHGRRRNLDRDSNAPPPSFNGRNVPGQPPVFPGPFPIPIPRPALPVIPYPPPPPPFSPMPFMAPAIHPFAGRPVLYGPPVGPVMMRPHPLYIPMGHPIIVTELLNQIDYYFSDENLVRDVHLRRNMDEQGWVIVNTIADFKKVKEIIAKVKPFLDNEEIDPLVFILNAMLNSHVVEVQGNKLRKRLDWKKYVLRNSSDSSATAAESAANTELAVRLENKVIEEKPNNTKAGDEATNDQVGKQPS